MMYADAHAPEETSTVFLARIRRDALICHQDEVMIATDRTADRLDKASHNCTAPAIPTHFPQGALHPPGGSHMRRGVFPSHFLLLLPCLLGCLLFFLFLFFFACVLLRSATDHSPLRSCAGARTDPTTVKETRDPAG